ncbi:GntR family transcriptional regulator [Clostridium beijerinckii]|uniref:HTH-type transcriptional repressor YtrA n=1 Tax=Clostridium beijerinckii TaxID=1520 RepID=A0A1S8S7M0_CLOBE|nr:GntR family transcriptional regulator [Clostridium beijerinckii]NRY60140.1 GntR family transcriptional regulator [Clostridium beijerinckii]OOM61480.1 HTH-type transcriptional repressor YtrA [Clostridium beijerinckii]
MKILLSNKSDLPIYEQIKAQIKEQILSGEILENEFLPSIRQLAKDLGISVITTTRAYSDLESEGFIATLRGKGSYVLPKDSEMVREQYLKKIEEALMVAIENGKLANISNDELVIMLKTLSDEQIT